MGTYAKLPLELFTKDYIHISSDAKIIYALLSDRVAISRENGFMDELGTYVYFSQDKLCEMLNSSSKSVRKYLKELEDAKLITRLHSGQGKPDRIYVNDIGAHQDEKNESETSEQSVTDYGNDTAGKIVPYKRGNVSPHDKGKTISAEGENIPPNQTIYIQTIYNHSSSSTVHSDIQGEDEDIAYINHNVEYEKLRTSYSTDQRLLCIMQIVYELVKKQNTRQQMLNLCRDDVEHVIKSLGKVDMTTKVNPKAYVTACLLNARNNAIFCKYSSRNKTIDIAAPNNRFNNFEQRQYDPDELERRLLNRQQL